MASSLEAPHDQQALGDARSHAVRWPAAISDTKRLRFWTSRVCALHETADRLTRWGARDMISEHNKLKAIDMIEM